MRTHHVRLVTYLVDSLKIGKSERIVDEAASIGHDRICNQDERDCLDCSFCSETSVAVTLGADLNAS